MVNADWQRRIFPSNFNDENNFSFHIIENKFKYNFSVALSYLNNNYKFSLLDYKICLPNFITNDVYINNHQKVYQNYEVKYPKIIMKLKKNYQNQEVKIIQLKTINLNICISHKYITVINLHINIFLTFFTFKIF